jgi:hypothetical protein
VDGAETAPGATYCNISTEEDDLREFRKKYLGQSPLERL